MVSHMMAKHSDDNGDFLVNPEELSPPDDEASAPLTPDQVNALLEPVGVRILWPPPPAEPDEVTQIPG